MNRRELLSIPWLCLPAAVLAQQPARVARVVFAQNNSEGARKRFRALFAEYGWVEGRNIALSFVDIVEAPKAEAEARAREVVASRPDAIVIIASPEIALLKRLTKDIPIVFYNLGYDPARLGLVESVRRPGGNVTGTSLHFERLGAKAWEMLKEILPAIKRGGVLREPIDLEDEVLRGMDSINREAWQTAASRLGIEIREIVVPEKATLAMAEEAIRKSKSDALFISMNPPGLIAFLEKARIPACGVRFAFARNGGLLAVSFDWEEGDKQAVAIVARTLRGESPAAIPVYQHNTYGFAVNLRTARAMGITIPASIRIQATEVIE